MQNSVGMGLRSPLLSGIHAELECGKITVPWFEIITENILNRKSAFFQEALRLREDVDISIHGVSLSLGSQKANPDYLKDLKALVKVLQPRFISDHLCWTQVDGQNLPDLLPLPFIRESVQIVTSRIQEVQEALGRPLMIENITQYVAFQNSEMTEGEFLKEVCQCSGCDILLDVNNIYVNQKNLNWSWREFLHAIPKQRVRQLHVAGHTEDEGIVIDTHGEAVCDAVLDILEEVYQKFGPIPTILERDTNIPPYSELLNELNQINQIYEKHSAKLSTPYATSHEKVCLA